MDEAIKLFTYEAIKLLGYVAIRLNGRMAADTELNTEPGADPTHCRSHENFSETILLDCRLVGNPMTVT